MQFHSVVCHKIGVSEVDLKGSPIVHLVVLVGGVLGAQAGHPTGGGREVLLLH